MLVKDIELVPSIVDLADNSVDGAKRLRPDASPMRYEGLEIHILASGEGFEIRDNCGGIDLDWARDYAFRFGRPEDIEGPLGEVGQFGVGMKRALFKLGRKFTITSTTVSNAFTLPVDVDEWMADPAPDWSFELSDVDDDANQRLEDTGTLIEVERIHPTVAQEMETPQFINRLAEELRLRQARVIAQGLTITVNGVAVGGFEANLLSGEGLRPVVVEEEIRVNGDSLNMKLYAGVIRLRDDDVQRADDEAEEFRQPPDAGWYLYCNDRLLLMADRTRLTGWGEAGAAYHPQYRQFRGYVLLEGPSRLMPWTTTKTSVDEDSAVFKRVQTAMFDALQKTQGAINRLKKETQSNPEEERPGVDALRAAAPVALERLDPSPRFVLPDPAPRTATAKIKWVHYAVDPEDLAAVAAELGVSSAVDVGRGTFQFYLDTQVPK